MPEKPKILIVDDDEYHLILLKRLFQNAGIEVSCATNGGDALLEMSINSFSCMITDFNMPRMNGIELATKAKKVAPSMPIVLCTGEDLNNIGWLLSVEVIEAVITKPVNYSDILAMVIEKIRHPNRAESEEIPENRTVEPTDVCQWLSI